jgi:UDP-N-acetylmuramoyl-L-alanyl-D-glutamate--2,6-diaminopimelate ligase
MTHPGPRPGARVSSDPVVPSLPPILSLPPVPLSAVVDAVPRAEIRGDAALSVVEVAFDSRDATPGCLFFCVPGARVDGHDFAPEAAAAGVGALVVQRWLPEIERPQIRVPSVRAAMGPMASVIFGHPSSAMTMVGITGTNGKTTITYLLESVFRASGRRAGVVGTTGARVDGRPVPLARTTPEAPDLHRLLAVMVAAGVQAVALEVSSHALDQFRVDGVQFDVAAFTNLSPDHLDYHPSMDAYFAAKARLFTPPLARRGVVNADDPWGRILLDDPSIPLTSFAAIGGADLRAEDVRVDAAGIGFRAGALTVRSSLRGGFNVTNALAAVAVAGALGIDGATAARGVEALRHVPGRMETVEAGQNFLVVVDYAHTPDSILSVLQAARPLTAGRIIVVFGCGGDRDRAKRPLMGAAAAANADLTIITSDNPRSEDPLAIIAAIEAGARETGGAFLVEPDRRAAIALAVDEAAEGDVVVIAGKGHETYQAFADRTLEHDDRVVAQASIEARGGRT